jgi:hypothetical protein
LHEIVIDKRLGKRTTEKRTRRNGHYGKQFIKNSLALEVFQLQVMSMKIRLMRLGKIKSLTAGGLGY